MAKGEGMAPSRYSRAAVTGIVAVAVLLVGLGVAWASSATRQRAISVSASYTIRVGADEYRQQRLFQVGDAIVGTECFGGIDPPGSGDFAVGGKSLTVTNTGSDPIMVWDVMGLGTVGPPSGPVVLGPGQSEAFGLVGVGTTVNDPGFGGVLPITILDQRGRSATGTYSFWYEAKPPADGTCVVSAQMHG